MLGWNPQTGGTKEQKTHRNMIGGKGDASRFLAMPSLMRIVSLASRGE
jgi:hypothetical protein